jgi:hypothetical protein
MGRRNRIEIPDAQYTVLLQQAGSNDKQVALAAQRELAKALELPLRQGILEGDIISPIFTPMVFQPGQYTEFPLDIVVPGTERDFSAYTIPNHGRIPERNLEGDYVMVPTYEVGSSVDWLLKFARDARWDVVGRCMQVLEATFVRKANLDGWRTVVAAAIDRNVVVFDAAAPSGFFTKRLVSLMKSLMRRAGGGNLSSLNPIQLSDIFLSVEAIEDIRAWNLTEIDDQTRRQIFQSRDDGGLAEIFGVALHEMIELGVGQLIQNYFLQLGGTLPAGRLEIAFGLDLSNPDVFVMPIRQQVEVFEDETLHRQRRAGFYGWGEHGFSVLDNRRIIIGAM